MSMMEPFVPHPDQGEVTVPAADPGPGAPETAPGTGPDALGEVEPGARDGEDAAVSAEGAVEGAVGGLPESTPFRTPDPGELGPRTGR
ncbi:hypothetical protein [Quadrisphaera sp. DSM 44207]|uniref:hypothetical protein n=1 Tax=Quadrisphaera sp. DSM 44207 TaxID=1881057 RepID=UPI00087FABF8|nr:hypothetical protein [Quadrisphaera sp. DSM 44207]SDQ70776.1 hypothetical protein SAMN05428996_2484 [Quadrisphaera sp. DSM 44207]